MNDSKVIPFRRRLPEIPPHIVHGNPNNEFPTHSHGLEKVKMPEMFINALAYGHVENAKVINLIFGYFWLNPYALEELKEKGEIEVDRDYTIADTKGASLMVRIVPNNFGGVIAAYHDKDLECKTGFAQIYVRGDLHVLRDSYYFPGRRI